MFTPNKFPYEFVRKRGMDVLQDPVFNKGSVFNDAEKERFGLRGLLPPRGSDLKSQKDKFMHMFETGFGKLDEEYLELKEITHEHVNKWRMLQNLKTKNETLFYRVLCENIKEFAPFIYTPTVAWVCLNMHILFEKQRGMWFSKNDKHHMVSMTWNWPSQEVDAIVVTDGGRILGLGDQGSNGIGVPMGKLDIYCAAGGFSPSKVLPVTIDVGTDNEYLRNHDTYLGLKEPRLQGREYVEIIDEFVSAVFSRWPNAVLQFEDFQTQNAALLLERYRQHHLVFNDDIQGTAATGLAGLYGALRVQGKKIEELSKQKLVMVGAGSAGVGVSSMILKGMQNQGLSQEDAKANLWMLDQHGLITNQRDEIPDHIKAFARQDDSIEEGASLLDVIQKAQPTILIGLAGAGRLFSEEILKAMASYQDTPIVFAMSNPGSRQECSFANAVQYTEGKVIFCSGTYEAPVEFRGKKHLASQANNMYIFPGLALGAFLGQTRIVSDNMLEAAAAGLSDCLTQEHVDKSLTFPEVGEIRYISSRVALQVIWQAKQDGHMCNDEINLILNTTKDDSKDRLLEYIQSNMYYPNYATQVYVPVGVNE